MEFSTSIFIKLIWNKRDSIYVTEDLHFVRRFDLKCAFLLLNTTHINIIFEEGNHFTKENI